MNMTATPMPVPAMKQPKIVTLSDAERTTMQAMLDNHALSLTEKIDLAIEEDNYGEAQRLAGILVKTIDSLRVLTKYKDRRKALQDAINKLDEAKVMLSDAQSDIETAKDEEQEYFDNMPEAFQQGDKGQAAEAAVAELDEAVSAIETAIDNINNSLG